MKFYPTEVTHLERPVKGALTITLKPPAEVYDDFNYQAGQHLIVSVSLDGEEYRRSYSLNSSPVADELLQVTVKRVQGGKVSNYLNEHVQIGDVLQVSSPTGQFTPDIQSQNHRTYYLFAAGSGITPMWSVAKTILMVEPYSYVCLLYGNKNEDSIIFRDALDGWQQEYAGRFMVEHILSAPLSHQWSSLFKNVESWQGRVGRIDAKTVQQFINAHPPPAQQVRYLMCGPGNMIPVVRDSLLALDVVDEDILFEYFGNPEDISSVSPKSVAANLNVRFGLSGQRQQVAVAADQNLLAAMLAQGVDAQYSCQSGVCGQCKVRLKSGEVKMKSRIALGDDEVAQGDILACQAYAQTEELEVEYSL